VTRRKEWLLHHFVIDLDNCLQARPGWHFLGNAGDRRLLDLNEDPSLLAEPGSVCKIKSSTRHRPRDRDDRYGKARSFWILVDHSLAKSGRRLSAPPTAKQLGS
jgi:hypothetical protein